MYNALTARYTFACPRREQAEVALSSFRLLERLPGASHPAVYGVRFDCWCGEEHTGLVAHDDLDWAPLGGHAGSFVDLMTSRTAAAADALLDTAAAHLKAGEWPWSFYCYPEGRPRPVFPSSFVAVSPGDRSVGLAVRCPSCSSLSVNLVSHAHVDLPFANDRQIGVVDHVFAEDALRSVESFTAELHSSRFDELRLHLG
ncbi:MAG: hypothetical protein M3R12_02295 [Actinomycetota bacterium]|nr:hypothetical protein [Actinomycetota bacterium]